MRRDRPWNDAILRTNLLRPDIKNGKLWPSSINWRSSETLMRSMRSWRMNNQRCHHFVRT